ncbi:hypothetical protein ACJ2PR_14380 [Phormidesmis sp. 146-33]
MSKKRLSLQQAYFALAHRMTKKWSSVAILADSIFLDLSHTTQKHWRPFNQKASNLAKSQLSALANQLIFS